MKKESIIHQIKSLNKEIFRSVIGEEVLNGDEFKKLPRPTPTQMQIIEYILKNMDKEIFQKDLEEVLNLTRATVSGVLQTMEKNNLIKRITDSQDTRTKKIILNDKAKEIFSKNKERFEKVEECIIKNISQEDLEIFSKVLAKMHKNLAEECLL